LQIKTLVVFENRQGFYIQSYVILRRLTPSGALPSVAEGSSALNVYGCPAQAFFNKSSVSDPLLTCFAVADWIASGWKGGVP
jgi:hypothetical protein